eukprot:TRINITY_DN6923_c0_g3_i1.p2 TRINITY_DN6923_c0_g3~~TRINITY_DN6923_c0_g3_i1.p2  ORF type:complete len:189 (+),score=12.95 TRINITY_DN6923_c0_g3_i1:553-1119(+)
MASVIASISSTIITQPLATLRTCMYLNRNDKAKLSLTDLARKIRRDSGFRGFYKGLSLSLVLSSYGMISMPTYEAINKKLKKKISPNSFLYSLISSFSGSVSTVISCVTLYPLQTVRTRVQQSILQSDHLKGKRVNALKIGGKMLRKEGFKGMYKGLIPCLTKSVPSSAIFFYCYESISNSLNRLYAH